MNVLLLIIGLLFWLAAAAIVAGVLWFAYTEAGWAGVVVTVVLSAVAWWGIRSE